LISLDKCRLIGIVIVQPYMSALLETNERDHEMLAEPGSISSGTLRTADLLRTFATELERSNATKYEYFVRLAYASADQIDIDVACDDDAAQELLADLGCELSKLAPAGYYFGAHIGDGADIGYWSEEDCA
jgi:hypothetical protein